MFLLDFLSSGVSRVTGVVKKYGESYYFMLHGNPHVLEFHPEHNSNVTILWKKDQRVITLDRKFVMTGSIFAIHKLTQNDSGHYISRDKDLKEISTYTLEVKGEYPSWLSSIILQYHSDKLSLLLSSNHEDL